MARGPATDTSALVVAAAEAFRDKGYHKATIDDIAEAAGISRARVYKYTKSKQQLLDLMVDEVTADLSRRTQLTLQSTDDPIERLRRVVENHVAAATANRTFYAIVFSEEVEISDSGRQQFRIWARGVTDEFETLISECLRAQPNPPVLDTSIAANLVLSMLTSLYRWYDPAGGVGPSQLVDEILALLSRLVPREASARRSL
jgi:AcrR family transcriptional regulator